MSQRTDCERARSIRLWMSMFSSIGSARRLHAPLGKRDEADFYIETNQRALKLNPSSILEDVNASSLRINYRKTVQLKPCVFMSRLSNLIAIPDLMLRYCTVYNMTSSELGQHKKRLDDDHFRAKCPNCSRHRDICY